MPLLWINQKVNNISKKDLDKVNLVLGLQIKVKKYKIVNIYFKNMKILKNNFRINK